MSNINKIFLSIVSIIAVAAIAATATAAYFSDTETSTGNTFAAGTINLQGDDSTLVPFTFSDIKPGDFNRKWLYFTNDGSLTIGSLSVDKTNVVDTVGLLDQLDVNFQCARSDDPDNMAFFTNSWGVAPTPRSTAANWFDDSDILDGPAFYRTAMGTIEPGQDYNCAMDFIFKNTAGNEYQGATASFDLIFTAEQVVTP